MHRTTGNAMLMGKNYTERGHMVCRIRSILWSFFSLLFNKIIGDKPSNNNGKIE